jgi:hypothetical protein
MRNWQWILALTVCIYMPASMAEVVSRAGNLAGTIDSVNVEAATKTKVAHWPKGADYKQEHTPFQFFGDWTFSWNSDTPELMTFAGDIHFGDHFTITDAGSMGGLTQQSFSDFTHHVTGDAHWDAASQTLTYSLEPGTRDAGGASTVTEVGKARCTKVKGMMASAGCNAFLDTSPELEGLKLNLVFSEDLSQVEGNAILVQFGGSGVTKSHSDMKVSLTGVLNR